ncbi:hypothetical protein Nepgr_009509 [Nepenthes gracilis]|uniref:Uncharacterized protein n=1 Tax=Nepenthes gracilis TaxID=150966 RepID=A0AAD3SBF1_NEPGR|nr:hypothetical protein Nepgr_009509 [Nepenthes gracilis]
MTAAREHLDLLEEARNKAQLCVAMYQSRVARYYNKKVKARRFEVGDLVLRSIAATGKNAGRNKLSPGGKDPSGLVMYFKMGRTSYEPKKVG